MMILVTGNPVDGLSFYGPFDEIADETLDKFEGDWWIADLNEIEPT